MKRVPVILLLLAFVMGGLGVIGCADENDPLYWCKKILKRQNREDAIKKVSEMFGRVKQANSNSLGAPAVKEFTDKVVPELIADFKELHRDRLNRIEIVKILSQMNDPRANEVYLEGLDVEDATDTQMFLISADALARGGVVEAIPKLLAAHDKLVRDRTLRGDAPFTNRENELDDSLVSAVVTIVGKNPSLPERSKIVDVLGQIADTRDTRQDLRINMKAIKGLGLIGDPAAIPALIRGIAIMGEVQKVGLGPFAFSSLQQIQDRDAVVSAIIRFGQGKDTAFNEYFKDELRNDPMLKVPLWSLQQATDFLGTLNYASPKVIEFLTSELNHKDPDDLDKQSAESASGAQKFDEDQWASWRRNWATTSLAKLGYKPLLDVIKDRFKIKKTGGKKGKTELSVTLEEAVGYVGSLGYLQYPAESCPLMLEVAKLGSEALRDKLFYNAAIMCGGEFLPIMKQEYDKTDCEKIVAERFPEDADEAEKKKGLEDCNTLKDRIKSYMDGIIHIQACKQDFDCLIKDATDRRNTGIEATIYAAFRMARGDDGRSRKLVTALTKELENPNMPVLEANTFVLDRLTPTGDKALIEQAEKVRINYASQAAYKDRARLLEAFIGHVKARTK